MSQAYITSMRQHVKEQLITLDELATQAKQSPLRKIERLATERALQILMEAAIGVGKQCCKQAGQTHMQDAYSNLLKAHDLIQSQIPHSMLKGATGMRNAIVHDYLNLDWTRIEQVIINQDYQKIGEFVEEGLSYLHSDED